jgi:galactokinase
VSAIGLWRGEAPGRLDFLGGVADYSGALVLQTPIAATTRVEVEPRQGSGAFSFGSERERTTFRPHRAALRALFSRDVGQWRAGLDELRAPTWTRYLLGCLGLFARETNWWPDEELRFRVSSDVPRSIGVSSSAALEVATLRALQHASGREVSELRLAHIAQEAENRVVGAPCGLMDQLASTFGKSGALLPILCRPDELGEPVALPLGVCAVGWPSGIQHSIAALPYARTRAAAFMGRAMLESRFGSRAYLSEFMPSVLDDELPVFLSGGEFMEQFGSLGDPLSRVEEEQLYPVRAAAHFGVEEHFRCQLAQALLRAEGARGNLPLVGELLFQSHAGYGAMGLGTFQTDAMVEAIRARGAHRGFYGARISGGGAGGTVVVLVEESSLAELEELRADFPASGALLR